MRSGADRGGARRQAGPRYDDGRVPGTTDDRGRHRGRRPRPGAPPPVRSGSRRSEAPCGPSSRHRRRPPVSPVRHSHVNSRFGQGSYTRRPGRPAPVQQGRRVRGTARGRRSGASVRAAGRCGAGGAPGDRRARHVREQEPRRAERRPGRPRPHASGHRRVLGSVGGRRRVPEPDEELHRNDAAAFAERGNWWPRVLDDVRHTLHFPFSAAFEYLDDAGREQIATGATGPGQPPRRPHGGPPQRGRPPGRRALRVEGRRRPGGVDRPACPRTGPARTGTGHSPVGEETGSGRAEPARLTPAGARGPSAPPPSGCPAGRRRRACGRSPRS